MGSYLRPVELGEALSALADGRRTILAGGTDYYPARVGQPLDDEILDITAIPALRGIARSAAGWRIPALTTWTELIEAGLPPLFEGLRRAAREVGGVQIQNAGTVCGNLCNASPAADGTPCLLSLDARVELASLRGTRALPVGEFVLGNRRTARAPDELVTAIVVPDHGDDARGHFLKLGARRYLVISIVMVAGVIETADDGTVTTARIAVGSCSAAATRLPALEAALTGAPATELAARLEAGHLAPLAPIDDIRGTAAYRRDAAHTLTRGLLADLAAPRRAAA